MPPSPNRQALQRRLRLAGALALVLPAAAVAAPVVDCAADRAIFLRPGSTEPAISLQVELADDAAERARGLMFRDRLPAGQGMLFAYPAPQPVAFWMKNTLIPLDMIFMDAGGTIRHVHAGARPHDETPIPGAAIGDPQPDRQFVLEVAGGEAQRLGLVPGVVMAHPAVDQADAAFSCR